MADYKRIGLVTDRGDYYCNACRAWGADATTIVEWHRGGTGDAIQLGSAEDRCAGCERTAREIALTTREPQVGDLVRIGPAWRMGSPAWHSDEMTGQIGTVVRIGSDRDAGIVRGDVRASLPIGDSPDLWISSARCVVLA